MHFTICDFILDCIQNSIEAGAKRIRVELIETGRAISARVEDDGKGMDEEELVRARDPFYSNGKKHRKRYVGLGIPFLIQAVRQTEGVFTLESDKGRGTIVGFSFPANHVDTPPLARPADMCLQAFCFDGGYELEFGRTVQKEEEYKEYRVQRSECIRAVGDLNDALSLKLLREYLRSLDEEIKKMPISTY